MTAGEEYRAQLHRLARLDADAAALREEAVRWHAERTALADEAERAAAAALEDAENELRAARRRLEEVQARAAGLWADFVHRVGPAAERFGPAPPEPLVPHQRGERPADDYLREVASRLAYAPPPRPLTNATRTMFAMFGAVGGALGFTVAEVLRWTGRHAGGDWAVGLPVLALIVTLVGPVAAIGAAKRVADHRHVGLDAVAVAVAGAAGLVMVGLLSAVLA